ncbi:MAG: GIY-YIG nuclease family protein [Bacteroidetes bacterium]|nr:GIY-YIG nuclease family protein [Bacteroidota bacterium]
MYYTYVLRSEKDGDFYVGFTKDLKQRFELHNKGRVDSTKNRRPLKLIYYEACIDIEDATKREKYLKTHYGRMYLKKRLKSYFTG